MEGKVTLREKIFLGLLILLLLAGVVWRALDNKISPDPEIIHAGINQEEAGEHEKTPELITVHLVGAVINPGVYQLPFGSRVYELIELCGGFSPGADREAINQARPLFDGEQVFIHKFGETPTSISGSPDQARININRASAAELTALPGIGDVRAEQIVLYRESHGYFTDIREITGISGIGETTFNNIADLITVY